MTAPTLQIKRLEGRVKELEEDLTYVSKALYDVNHTLYTPCRAADMAMEEIKLLRRQLIDAANKRKVSE